MRTLLGPDTDRSLGRLCSGPGDVILTAPPYPGLERIEARFSGEAFARHRHDTYALGVTLRGVQTFWYRGEQRASLPGQVIVLHPDEVHDGGAGTEAGLLYRMLYMEPALICLALGGSPGLPFVADPVIVDVALRAILLDGLGDMDGEIDSLVIDQLSVDLSEGLARHARLPGARNSALATTALRRVKELLDASLVEAVSSKDLEAISGLDRFTLTRQFKSAFATSPHRYLVMRRLGHGRRLLVEGHSIADAAATTGFADQSHFHRQFVKAFGLTPGHWRRLVQGDTASGGRPQD